MSELHALGNYRAVFRALSSFDAALNGSRVLLYSTYTSPNLRPAQVADRYLDTPNGT
ncbi:hypothetical protein [Nocardia sp. XZ_19_369]|uniref:hypothetical protein n=1 Tax=Nocardia sp. XZ_19_369 TaxID=2769487 RepID=UPI0018907631|nr:hypothetical protein [Nocardia sp. XZ_19_369]